MRKMELFNEGVLPDDEIKKLLLKVVLKELTNKFPEEQEENLKRVALETIDAKLAELPTQKKLRFGKFGGHPSYNKEPVDKVTNDIFGNKPIKNGVSYSVHRSRAKGYVSIVCNPENEKATMSDGQVVMLCPDWLGEKERNYAAAIVSLATYGTTEFTFKQMLRELNPAYVDKKHLSKKEYREIFDICRLLGMPVTVMQKRHGQTVPILQGPLLATKLESIFTDNGSDLENETNCKITVWPESIIFKYAEQVNEILTYPKELLKPAGNRGLIHEGRYLLRRLNAMHQQREKAKGKGYTMTIDFSVLVGINKPSNISRFRQNVCGLLDEWIAQKARLTDDGQQMLYGYKINKKNGRIHSIDLIIDEAKLIG